MVGLKAILLGLAAVAAVTVGVVAVIEARRVDAPAESELRADPPVSLGADSGSATGADAQVDAMEEAGGASAVPEPAPAPPPPRFDLVRVEPSGAALVAGQAEPGDVVEILIDSAAVTEAKADASGAFAVSFDMPRGGGLRRLDLRARGASGVRLSLEPVFVSAPEADQLDDEAPLVAQARQDGVALLQAPPRPPEAPVTLDILSYSPEGAVVMQGRATPNGTVRVYADAIIIAEAQVSQSGEWTVEGAVELAPGDYTLRVDEIGLEGQVVSRVETPFQRATANEAALAEGQIVVQSGDSLWRLAEQVYGRGLRYTVIYDSNRARIRDPDLIYPGQILSLPRSAPTP